MHSYRRGFKSYKSLKIYLMDNLIVIIFIIFIRKSNRTLAIKESHHIINAIIVAQSYFKKFS